MAITKRTRYEVLRRDNYTCRYCGASAPNVELQVDHVIPKALGGGDAPDNLVAACRDCNAGKTSSQPDSAQVAQVKAQAVAMSIALKTAFDTRMGGLKEDEKWCRHFKRKWDKTTDEQGLMYAKPDDNWRNTIARWRGMGVPLEVIDDAVEKALRKYGLRQSDRFAYMCGIVWNVIKDATNEAMSHADSGHKKCGHCDNCLHPERHEGEDDYCSIYGPFEDGDEEYECDICHQRGCLYGLGIQDGMMHQYMDDCRRFRPAIDHYRDCEAVSHGER